MKSLKSSMKFTRQESEISLLSSYVLVCQNVYKVCLLVTRYGLKISFILQFHSKSDFSSSLADSNSEMNCTLIFHPCLCISSISSPVYAQTADNLMPQWCSVLSVPHIHSDNTDNFLPQWCCVVSSPHAFRQRRLHATCAVLSCQFPTCTQITQTLCHKCCVVFSVPHMHSDNTDNLGSRWCSKPTV